MMEAVACGTPAIAADVGGVASIHGLAKVLPVSAGAREWADAVEAHMGRTEPRCYPDHSGRLMAMRYGWLYRAMLIRRAMCQ